MREGDLTPTLLPIHDLDKEIIRAVAGKNRPRLVLSAPTGSGKSTQVPQLLLDSGMVDGEIAVLQPRRIAARLLANRVARERGGTPGGEVGYQVRFDSRGGPSTRIRYVTEGVLLRRLFGNPELRGVGAVIFDEFHERHLYGDISLARLKLLQEAARPDLVIVVMSATLDTGGLLDYLQPCALLESEGRQFPVEIAYHPARERRQHGGVWDEAADACEAAIARERREGDVLVFMPGGYEIRRCIEALSRRSWTRGWRILPLHGELSPEAQDAAVERYAERKIIVATNVAETSLTIDGVRIVIDSGLARIAKFDPHRGINTLTVQRISRASADQRAGRAGRTAPGFCLRLWSERDHAARAPRERPEVERVDLSESVLTLMAQGCEDVRRFPWLEAPGEAAIGRAETLLCDLGALEAPPDRPGPMAVTESGRRLLSFPLHPRFGRMLLEAGNFGCVREACMMAALAQGREIFAANRDGSAGVSRENYVREGDHSDFEAMLRALESARQVDFRAERCAPLGINGRAAREAWALADQFLAIARSNGIEAAGGASAGGEALAKTLLAGFADQVGARPSRGSAVYDLVHGRRGKLDAASVAKGSDLVVAAEVAEIEGRDLQVILSKAARLEEDWLREVFPRHVDRVRSVFFDAASRRVVARGEVRFRDLAIGSASAGDPSDAEAAHILAAEVLAGRLVLKLWDHSVEQWIARLDLLRRTMPEAAMPSLDEDDRRVLLEDLFLGARGYKDIRDIPVLPGLARWLSPAQRQRLDACAPERVTLENGRSVKVHYEPEGEPWIAATIQHLYGVRATPCIAEGRVPLVVKLLAPNQRPVQVTKDLAGFWNSGYAEVKKQLQGRYPRHEWR